MCEEDENHGLFPSIGAPGQRNVSAFPLDAEQIPRRAVTVMGTAWVKVIDAALNWDVDVGMSTCPPTAAVLSLVLVLLMSVTLAQHTANSVHEISNLG